MDFNTGDLLMLTGSVELLWDEDATVTAFKGSERSWRFTLDHGIRLTAALPFRAKFFDYSPHSEMTGSWAQAGALKAAEAKREEWRPYRLARIKDESSLIRSFYFEPADGHTLLPFEAGQYLTLRLATEENADPFIRTYTVSSAPGEDFYRISVKREENGHISRHLHDRLKPGDIIEAKAPRGDFFIDPTETRPAVLLAGGVGITPMISMALHVVSEGVRTRHVRPLTIFHSAQTTEQRAFSDLFNLLQQQTEGAAIFEPEEEAEISIITFTASGFEQRWNAGDATLLETAENHGLSPAFSCRDGKCGSCATKIKSGSVAYRTKPTATVAEDEVLLCCSVPAKGSDVIELGL